MSNQNSVEINLMSLVRMILLRWRWLIAAVLIGGCLFGAYRFAQAYHNTTDPDTAAAWSVQYERNLQTYFDKKDLLETRIENLSREMDLQEDIQKNNLMLRMDPYDVYVATMTYYVDVGYTIVPELSYQNTDKTARTVNSYRSAVQKIDLREVLADAAGEEVLVDNPVSGNTFAVLSVNAETANGLLFITINAPDQETADVIGKAVSAVIEEAHSEFEAVYGEHDVSLIEQSGVRKISLDLLDMQEKYSDHLEDMISALSDAYDEYQSLGDPPYTATGANYIVKDTVKYGLIGGAAGLIVICLWFVVRGIVRDRLWDLSEIPSRYHVPVLGTFPAGEIPLKTKLDRWLARKFGVTVWTSEEQAAAYLRENSKLFLGGNAVVLLGSGCEKTLEKIYGALKSSGPDEAFLLGGDLKLSPEAVSALMKAEAVLLVAKWQKTEHKALLEELNTVWKAVGKEKTAVVVAV